MKKIVKGNDFTLKIPVMKMVEGQAKAFPLPACTDVVVQVCNQFKRIPLAFEIDVKEDNVLLARVEGDKMSLGTYAIEVKGKIFGNDWRSNEYPQVAIVANNADADTEFGETDEGDNSVEMDTAMVILPPSVELSDLINKANETLKTNKETNDTINVNEEARKEAETLRKTAEQGRVSAEAERAKADKIAEITDYDTSDKVNGFVLNGLLVWLDKATRVGLMNSTTIAKAAGQETTTLWFGGLKLVVDCDKAIQLLSALEMYALECFNVTSSHKAAVNELKTIGEVEVYNYKAGYPKMLEMNV